MSLRVMIVEDSPVARMMLGDMLQSRGHQVVAEVETLEQAVDAYRAQKPDLITLDLSLGRQDGLTVLKAIRGIDAKAKVLVISGNAQKNIHALLMSSGASGFLTKPYSISELDSAIAQASAL